MFSKEFDFENVAQRKDGGISLSVDYTIPLTLNTTTFRRLFVCEYQCRESAWPNFCIRDNKY